MSGTSLDGIDVVAVSFAPKFKLVASASFELPANIKALILELCSSGNHEIDKMGHLDIALAKLFADGCNQLIRSNSATFKLSQIRAIGLHGQTIRHRPSHSPRHNFSLQIGDANTVAENTGITTIADFRRRDIAAGGQGAPLVPAFHQSVFYSPNCDRVIVNIGGMANITLLAKDAEQPLIGFDTGPGNVLLDAWIQYHQQQNFDANGDWASTGIVNKALLTELLSLAFFSQGYPKSTGREQFNLAWLHQQLANIANSHNLISAVDVQATLVELSATTIAAQIKQQQFASAEIFVCGGGAKNTHLMSRLAVLLPNAISVTSTTKLQLDPDWVEAAAFAWLAKQTLAGLTGNSTSVTGAKNQRILGAIFQA
ncbi:MAG: anhydro-N-acetylmuramic acid kinase [Oceanospirillaceae bacterium]|nr:anhydro-N-acetylmuramic acid kinase [Oceanospirillaceae bacterium]